MTTPDPAAPATVVAGHRLHPMSWLFELIAQLRQFLVPLLALVVFGQGDRSELWPLAGVAVLVAASLWRYFAFRYQPEADQLRSEEHTSELQSRENLVCRLLLEKKNH